MRTAALLAVLACCAGAACSPPAPRHGADTLVIGMALEPPNLDPTAGAAAATDEIVYANVFEGLTRIDRTGAVQPALASSWQISPDGRSYRFFLQPDVAFHDGSRFDAQDVKFSLDRARAPGSLNAQPALFAAIKQVVVEAPLVVRIDLARPVADFPRALAWGDAVIVAPESAATNAQTPVGTGPFRFERWQAGEAVRLVRQDRYWGKAASLAQVEFRFIADPAAAYGALMAGDVDGFANFPSPELVGLLRRDARFAVTVGTTEGETVLALNQARPPFNDIRVRQAVALAVDRDAIITGAMFGFGTPISSFYPAHGPAHVDLSALTVHDPARARQLLAAAGKAQGFTVNLTLPPTSYARRSGEIIAAQLAAIGITVHLVPMEWAQWLSQVLANRNYDMTIVAHTEPDDIGFFARADNYFGYRSAAFDGLVARLETVATPAEKAALLAAAQRQLAGDHAAVFLFQLAQVGVWHRAVSGMWADAPIQATDVTGITKAPS